MPARGWDFGATRSPLSVFGALTYTNKAMGSREGGTQILVDLSSAMGLLRAGPNVLCLQAYNRSLTDDDFRIDVELAETPGGFAFSPNTYAVSESQTQLVVRVVGSGALDPGATVDYATANLTAVAGLHYTGVAGTLAFAPGETNLTIVVPILNNGLVEGNRNFQVILRNPVNALLGTPAIASVSLKDNDVGLQFVLDSYSVAEDAGAVLLGVVRGDDGNLPVTDRCT